MAEIQVSRTDDGRYRVEVHEGGSATHHEVTVSDEQLRHYGGGQDAEALLRASFAFLLEREPKEAILRRFELPEIERYFPDFPQEIRKRIG